MHAIILLCDSKDYLGSIDKTIFSFNKWAFASQLHALPTTFFEKNKRIISVCQSDFLYAFRGADYLGANRNLPWLRRFKTPVGVNGKL